MNLSLCQMTRADELLCTVVKHQPVDMDVSSEVESVDASSKIDSLDSWFELLQGVKSDMEYGVAR